MPHQWLWSSILLLFILADCLLLLYFYQARVWLLYSALTIIFNNYMLRNWLIRESLFNKKTDIFDPVFPLSMFPSCVTSDGWHLCTYLSPHWQMLKLNTRVTDVGGAEHCKHQTLTELLGWASDLISEGVTLVSWWRQDHQKCSVSA